MFVVVNGFDDVLI